MSAADRRNGALAARWAPLAPWLVGVLALPLMPSQDGGAHLASAVALRAWLRGDELARSLLELTPGLWTNWGATAVLTSGLSLGLSPPWAEKLLLVLIGAVWIGAFGAIARRLASSSVSSISWVSWLALPCLLSKVSFLGFWSFLLSAGLGLLAIGCRPSPGAGAKDRSVALHLALHLALLMATLSHPLGGLLALGVLGLEDLLARAPRRLLWLAPHGAVWLAAITGGLSGSAGTLAPPERLDWSAAILDVRVGLSLGDLPRFALVALVALWLLAWSGSCLAAWRRGELADTAGLGSLVPLRIALAVAALATFVAAALGPDKLGGGTFLRPRFALLGWATLLLTLPPLSPRARVGPRLGRLLPPLVATSALLVAASAWLQASRLAAEQAGLLAALPERSPGPLVVSSYGGLWRQDPATDRFGMADVRVGSRWAARVGALDLGNYQLHTTHFPLRARHPLRADVVDALQWQPGFAPWPELARWVDGAILVDPPRRHDETLGCRLAGDWRTLHRVDRGDGVGALVLVPRAERAAAGLEGLSPVDLSSLRPVLPPPALPVAGPGRFTPPDADAYACRAWRALVVAPDGAARIATRDEAMPIDGVFDARGSTALERVAPPPGTRIVVQPR
ncbi:MAG: hypothetical protein AAGC60_16015 [Acidobacteriota bacterium]